MCMTSWHDSLILYPLTWLAYPKFAPHLKLLNVFAVERYNTLSDKWETCSSMAIKRGSLGGATVREKIYALGGGNGSTSFNDTECFDPIVGTWTASTKMLERVLLSPITVLSLIRERILFLN